MRLRKRAAAPVPDLSKNDDPSSWAYRIEAMQPSVLGRYRVYLVVTLWMHYGGNDGWGWGAWTRAGAHRKGRRELALYRRQKARVAARQREVDA